MSCCASCQDGRGCAGDIFLAERYSPVPYVSGVGGWLGDTGAWLSQAAGSFLQSGVGEALLQIGTTVGTAALADSLFGSSGGGGSQPAPAPTSPTSPAAQTPPIASTPNPIIISQPAAPDYTVPIIVGVGVLAVALMVGMRK